MNGEIEKGGLSRKKLIPLIFLAPGVAGNITAQVFDRIDE